MLSLAFSPSVWDGGPGAAARFSSCPAESRVRALVAALGGGGKGSLLPHLRTTLPGWEPQERTMNSLTSVS